MENKRLRHIFLVPMLFVLAIWGCKQPEESVPTLVYQEASTSTFQYPESKIWSHGANDISLARTAEAKFDGIELDLNYSEYQDRLYVGHELYDTARGLTIGTWFDSLYHPDSNCYWLDVKNLTPQNASGISHQILQAARRHNIIQRVMVESQDPQALKIVKDSGLHVILWVDNIWWSGRSEEIWFENTCKQVEELHPDALSGDYHNFPRLPDAFPNQNIHIWDTPREYNDTNVAHSQMIASHPSVKVVLVDYPDPFETD